MLGIVFTEMSEINPCPYRACIFFFDSFKMGTNWYLLRITRKEVDCLIDF